jgi:hypothetical protein
MSYTKDRFRTLFKPFSDHAKQSKRQGGSNITFVPWYTYVTRAHVEFPEGYSKEVRYVEQINGLNKDGEATHTLIVCVRITDNSTEEHHEALGSADAGKQSWGGAVAEAESQAMRRAFANFGLGLEMYMEEAAADAIAAHLADQAEDEDPFGEPDEPEAEAEDDGPELDEHNLDDGAAVDDAVTKDGDPTERQIEVLRVIGQKLNEEKEKTLDGELANFLDAQREKLDPATTRTYGLVIRNFREELERRGMEDPSKRDDS